jgi:hypothetical protein
MLWVGGPGGGPAGWEDTGGGAAPPRGCVPSAIAPLETKTTRRFSAITAAISRARRGMSSWSLASTREPTFTTRRRALVSSSRAFMARSDTTRLGSEKPNRLLLYGRPCNERVRGAFMQGMVKLGLRTALGGGLIAALVGCGAAPAKKLGAGGPVTARRSSAEGRQKVAITIYNSDFGLVREERRLELGQGRIELSYADVSAHIQPETVHLRALDQPSALEVLEQNYRYDLITPEKLLEKYVGKRVKVVRYNEKLGTDETKVAEVLAVESGPVLRIDNEVVTGFPGRFVFPDLPPNLVAKPTLVWLLASGVASQRVEVSYLTSNLSWRADYVLVLDAKDETGDLTGWVTLTNGTGTTYRNAELKLVAGDVQRVTPPAVPEPIAMDEMKPEAAPAPPPFKQESLFEYHLYTLQRPTDLLDRETKQVTLLEAHGIKLKKKLEFRGNESWYRGGYGQLASNEKVGVFVELDNSEKSGLGMPLPKGTVRVYKADQSGAQQFVGENAIDHTPRDEKVEIKLGDAFDVVADRKQTEWKALGNCASESAWQLDLRNHKDTAVTVEDIEPASGDWEIVQASHPATKKDAQTFVFEVPVPARGATKITYRVRIRWC